MTVMINNAELYEPGAIKDPEEDAYYQLMCLTVDRMDHLKSTDALDGYGAVYAMSVVTYVLGTLRDMGVMGNTEYLRIVHRADRVIAGMSESELVKRIWC